VYVRVEVCGTKELRGWENKGLCTLGLKSVAQKSYVAGNIERRECVLCCIKPNSADVFLVVETVRVKQEMHTYWIASSCLKVNIKMTFTRLLMAECNSVADVVSGVGTDKVSDTGTF
jgi:hypothetical protein